MRIKRFLPLALVAIAVIALAIVAGSARASSQGHHAAAAPLKVGLVTDIGGLNDRSFNHLAYVGLQAAQKKLKVSGRVLESKSAADYVPNLSSLAQQGYGLVIAVGFLMTDSVDQVAKQFPNTKFAIIDVDATSIADKPANVQGILFKEQESGYIAGYLAGLEMKAKGGKQVAGTVGGLKIPPVDRYIAGFKAGLVAADPGATELNGYSQDFVDQAKCKEVALNQIAQGSQVEFQVAGGCGLGVLDAAKEKGIWGVGVDADQSYLGPQMLTSAIKKVDQGVYQTVQRTLAGKYKGNWNLVLGVAQGGSGIGKISSKVPKAIVAKVNAVQAAIKAGKIKNIPTTVA
ncbi:MAG TPA: BMP family ABC transporter substrate-binding protein [Gaiellaceae bacterium]|nr:BMP family ABC transporter substrate-binding protein [Gaiellaceae bacterium]